MFYTFFSPYGPYDMVYNIIDIIWNWLFFRIYHVKMYLNWPFNKNFQQNENFDLLWHLALPGDVKYYNDNYNL